MEKKLIVAEEMSKAVGIRIDPNLVIRFPWDGTPGHLLTNYWDVYGCRCGEFTILAFVYENDIKIHII